jgi:putative transposase
MAPVNRRITYKLYPTDTQKAAMWRMHQLHCDLHNAARQERMDAYRLAGKSIGFAAQCKSLTEIRAEHPEYLALNAQSAQVTLKRVDLAFDAFFRRVREGETPGFPRFKLYDRFPGFGYKHHGDGFRFTPGKGWKHGKLRLSGVGTMQARGEARTPGKIVSADIMRKADGWFMSLVVECEPHRECGDLEAGLDWGVETFATLAYGPGEYDSFPNERLLNAETEALKQEQRELSKALRGKRSKRAQKARKALARRHRKVANRRKNNTHQTAAKLIAKHCLIVTEELPIKNMTASAKGTVEKPGKKVAQKAGLNRAILDTAPGSLINNLHVKAEEAGRCQVIVLNTRKHTPSQKCPGCKAIVKKDLDEREHNCGCGFHASRDQASALSMLLDGLKLLGREPCPGPSGSETQPRARSA